MQFFLINSSVLLFYIYRVIFVEEHDFGRVHSQSYVNALGPVAKVTTRNEASNADFTTEKLYAAISAILILESRRER